MELSSRNPDFNITVLCGSNYRNFEFSNNYSPPLRIGKVNIKRLNTIKPGKNIRLRIWEFFLFYFKSFFYLIRNRDKFDCAIVFTSPPLIGFWISHLIVRETPLIYYVEDLFPEILFDLGLIERYWLVKRMHFINQKIFARADKIISLGKYMTRKMQCNYVIPDEKIIEIENWSHNRPFIPPIKKEKMQILYSGNMGLAHDFSLFSVLLIEIEKKELPVKFIFQGAGRQSKILKKLVRESNVEIEFRNYSKKEQHYYDLEEADVFFLAQKSETIGDVLPSKIYSYLATGRPMFFLGSEKSEIGEIILNNELGIVVEIESDIKKLIDFIQNIINDFEQHYAISKNCYIYYQKNKGFKKSLFEVEAVIRESFCE